LAFDAPLFDAPWLADLAVGSIGIFLTMPFVTKGFAAPFAAPFGAGSLARVCDLLKPLLLPKPLIADSLVGGSFVEPFTTDPFDTAGFEPAGFDTAEFDTADFDTADFDTNGLAIATAAFATVSAGRAATWSLRTPARSADADRNWAVELFAPRAAGGRDLGRLTRSRALTSCSFRMPCQPCTPRFLAISARSLQLYDLSVSAVIVRLLSVPPEGAWNSPQWRGETCFDQSSVTGTRSLELGGIPWPPKFDAT
jgi:hypothetical protein